MKWKWCVAGSIGLVVLLLIYFLYFLMTPLNTLVGSGSDSMWIEWITQFKNDTKEVSHSFGYYDWEDMDVLPGAVDVVYFSQKDPAWAANYYDTRRNKTQTIRSGGCGPTSLAIVYTSLTQDVITPAVMADWAMEQGYCAAPSGSYRSLMSAGAEELGLTNYYSGSDLETALGYLSDGKLIVALMGPGIFCDGGHFVVIRGVTEDGKILMADCWNADNNDVEWDITTIAQNLKTDSGNCLWVIGYEGDIEEGDEE